MQRISTLKVAGLGDQRSPDDVRGDGTKEDVFPAYDVEGGPPKYGLFLAVDLGTGTNARLQITETVPVGALPQRSPTAG